MQFDEWAQVDAFVTITHEKNCWVCAVLLTVVRRWGSTTIPERLTVRVAAVIYSDCITNSSNEPLNHRWQWYLFVVKRQEDNQWFIYRADAEKDFTMDMMAQRFEKKRVKERKQIRKISRKNVLRATFYWMSQSRTLANNPNNIISLQLASQISSLMLLRCGMREACTVYFHKYQFYVGKWQINVVVVFVCTRCSYICPGFLVMKANKALNPIPPASARLRCTMWSFMLQYLLYLEPDSLVFIVFQHNSAGIICSSQRK